MELKRGERWLQQVLDAMTEHIAVLDRHGTVLMVNEAWRRFGHENGSPDSSCFGVNYLEVCRRASLYSGDGAESARQLLEGLRSVLSGDLAHFQMEYACHSPRERRWFELNATPLTASPGGAVVTHVNVTARKLREEEILRQAHQDPLTGLPNRRRVEAQAVSVLAKARRGGSSAAVLVMDLDGFKAVNDAFGHHAGDLVLREVAARLSARLRPADLLARLGGDEFVALLPGAGAREARSVADSYLAALAPPLVVEGREVFVGASLGVAVFPGDGDTFAELLRVADAEMYRVKSGGARERLQDRRAVRLSLAARIDSAA